jgi:plasmid maintenance system killer protein
VRKALNLAGKNIRQNDNSHPARVHENIVDNLMLQLSWKVNENYKIIKIIEVKKVFDIEKKIEVSL